MEPSYVYRATVTRWVDGDTVDLRVDLGFKMWAETRFRLYGIDTPERGQQGWAEATAAAKQMAPEGSSVMVTSYKDADKYGRWLAVISAGEINVNAQLMDDGHAVAYFGGTKGV